MKKLLSGYALLAILMLFIAFLQIGCVKSNNSSPVDENPSTVTLTKEQILVQKTWKVDELHNVISGKYGAYYSNGTNTTGVAYENQRYTFNANGTGSYTDETKKVSSITWEFTSADKKTIKFTIGNATPNIWEMVEITGNYLYVTQNFSVNGNANNMHSFRLVQIP